MINTPPASLKDFILVLLKPYKMLLSIIGLIGFVWALINTFSPYTLKLIIDHAVSFEGSREKVFEAWPYVFAYIFLWVILSVAMRLLDWVKLKLFPQLRRDIMTKMFHYLSQHANEYFQNNFAGSLINKIANMQNGVIEIMTVLDDLYAQLLGIVVAIISLLFIHPVFAVILVIWMVIFLVITYFFLKPIQALSHVFSESKTVVIGKMVDSISNIANIRLFARQKYENKYIGQSIEDAVQKDMAMQRKIIVMRVGWDISIIFLMTCNVLLLLYLYRNAFVSIGDFTFIIILTTSVLWNLWFLASQFVSFSEQLGLCKEALSIIIQPHGIVDAMDAKPLSVTKGKIEFNDVTFNYDEGSCLFKNKNIVIEGGQKIGLVGFSGSGKSSFVNLILRLFEVESGAILIDNQNINHVTQDSLREQIALIPQDITLFHRSLMENIRFGQLEASEAEVIEASKKAHCHEFISELSEGYASMVGERGIKLSGGQRQRIAIARAILKNAPLLIMDEATSSLDSITEQYIQEALGFLMQNKTTIVIAHRLSTLSKMDRILVFHKGVIVEDGTHESLIAEGAHYARMWQMQAGGFLPDNET